MDQEGYAGASISYRLTNYPDKPLFPAQIWDVKVAIRFLREKASQYGYDPKRFAVFGTSAGGYLAALLGTSCGIKDLEGGTLYGTSSSCVQAVVDFFGPTDLLNMDLHVTTPPGSDVTHDAPDSPESLLFGLAKGIGDLRRNFNSPTAPYPTYKALMLLGNPLTHVDATDPPFSIAHGLKDRLVPLKQSTILANALKAVGVKTEYHEVANYGHGDLGTPVELDALRFLEALFFPATTEPPAPEQPQQEPPAQERAAPEPVIQEARPEPTQEPVVSELPGTTDSGAPERTVPPEPAADQGGAPPPPDRPISLTPDLSQTNDTNGQDSATEPPKGRCGCDSLTTESQCLWLGLALLFLWRAGRRSQESAIH